MIFIILAGIALFGWFITYMAESPPAANVGMLLFVIGLIGMLIGMLIDALISIIA